MTLGEKENELYQSKIQKQYDKVVLHNHTSIPEVSDIRPTFMDADRRETIQQ